MIFIKTWWSSSYTGLNLCLINFNKLPCYFSDKATLKLHILNFVYSSCQVLLLSLPFFWSFNFTSHFVFPLNLPSFSFLNMSCSPASGSLNSCFYFIDHSFPFCSYITLSAFSALPALPSFLSFFSLRFSLTVPAPIAWSFHNPCDSLY